MDIKLYMRRSIKFFLYTIVVFVAILSIHYLIFMYPSLRDDYERSDVIVVFGNKVEKDGRPSERLKRRLDTVIRLYNEGAAKKIVASGGLGAEGYDEPAVMKKYLEGCKVLPADIITDSAGLDTFSTVKNVRAMNFVKPSTKIISVTDYYHIPRVRLAFRKAGFINVGAARANTAPETTDIKSVVREFFAYYYYMARNYD